MKILDPLNFDFLKETDSRLAELGSEAENFLYQHRYGACIITIRKFAERLTRIVARESGIANYNRQSLFRLLEQLRSGRNIESEQLGWLQTIRKAGNQVQAAHESADTYLPIPADNVREYLEYALKLGEWFNRSYGDNPNFKAESFKSPLLDSAKF
jgi:type I restriction enzyme R subunit